MLQNHILYAVLLVFGFVSCTSSSKKTVTNNESSPQVRSVQPRPTAQINIVNPQSDTTLNLGANLEILLSFEDQVPVALKTTINGQNISINANRDFKILNIPTSQGVIGENILEIEVILPDSSRGRTYCTFHLLSDTTPVRQSYSVVDEFPHNDESFTQGLIYLSGTVCEGSGLQGKSVITCFEPRTGKVIQQAFMPPEYFGEGISQLDGVLYQLTYKANKIILYNPENLNKIGEKYWPSEGWGITHNGSQLIVSDGSDQIYFLDPVSLTEVRRITVADDTRFFDRLNELEYVEGVIYANVWLTDSIVGIDPSMGRVLSTMHLKNILPGFNAEEQEDRVLNGIAYIPDRRSLLVTGKQWPKMFEIQISPLVPAP